MFSCLSAVISLIVIAIIFDFVKRWNRGMKYISEFPGPGLTLPFIGNSYLAIGPRTKPADSTNKWREKYGRSWRFWLKDEPFIWTSERSIVKTILASPTQIEKASIYSSLAEVTAKYALVGSPGSIWRHDRKRFLPAFQKDSLDLALCYSNAEAKVVLKKLAQTESQEIDFMRIICTCYLNVFLRTMIELSETDLAKFSDRLMNLVDRFKSLGLTLILKPWATIFGIWHLLGYHGEQKRLKQDLLELVNEFDAVIKSNEQKQTLDGKPIINERSLATIFFDPAEPIEWRGDHILSTTLAGMDTSALTVCFTLFYLALHPEYLSRVLEEVDLVFSESDEDCDVTYSHLSDLKLTEMCWKEAMRLHPPGPIIGRMLTENVELDDGRRIPVGANVIIDIRHIHRDPDNFSDPNTFYPERFTQEIKPYTYLPFSTGSRNCIGQKFGTTEAKTVLVQILRKFTVTTTQKPEDLKLIIQITGDPIPALDLRFHRRNVINNNSG